MKLFDYNKIFRIFTEMLGRNAGCYADGVLPELS